MWRKWSRDTLWRPGRGPRGPICDDQVEVLEDATIYLSLWVSTKSIRSTIFPYKPSPIIGDLELIEWSQHVLQDFSQIIWKNTVNAGKVRNYMSNINDEFWCNSNILTLHSEGLYEFTSWKQSFAREMFHTPNPPKTRHGFLCTGLPFEISPANIQTLTVQGFSWPSKPRQGFKHYVPWYKTSKQESRKVGRSVDADSQQKVVHS